MEESEHRDTEGYSGRLEENRGGRKGRVGEGWREKGLGQRKELRGRVKWGGMGGRWKVEGGKGERKTESFLFQGKTKS